MSLKSEAVTLESSGIVLERKNLTGSRIFCELWSYVEDLTSIRQYMSTVDKPGYTSRQWLDNTMEEY